MVNRKGREEERNEEHVRVAWAVGMSGRGHAGISRRLDANRPDNHDSMCQILGMFSLSIRLCAVTDTCSMIPSLETKDKCRGG